MSETPSGTVQWDEEVRVEVTVRVRVRANPDYFDGLLGRTPQQLAQAAIITGRGDPAGIDGFADFTGSVDIDYVQEAV